MLTEAFRTCALGPSRPSVRPGSPGPAGRAVRAVRARGFFLARARKVVFTRLARAGCARPRIQAFTKELGCVCDRTKNEVRTAYGVNTCLLGSRAPPGKKRFPFFADSNVAEGAEEVCFTSQCSDGGNALSRKVDSPTSMPLQSHLSTNCSVLSI